MKNISTHKKKMGRTTATVFEVGIAVGCWVLSLSTNYRDFSAIVSSAAPKKCACVDSTSKTQGNGVGDRSRKMVVSRSLGAWSRFAQDCSAPSLLPLQLGLLFSFSPSDSAPSTFIPPTRPPLSFFPSAE